MALSEIKIQNTLTGKKEPFRPKKPGQVQFYACGPTVYGYAHVGNAKTSISMDIINRVLRHAGYKVTFARNITDVDDKIIKVANDENRAWDSVAAQFTETYETEMRALGNLKPDLVPKATQHIPEMIAMIETLIQKDLAYPASTPYGNDVYFRVTKYEGYGKLSRKNIEDLQAGARIEPGEMKDDPLDFALWKAAKPGEPSWESPWGAGRPGWHIECSAMIHKHFHTDCDLHGGGLDLIFPHHENEVAQSEGATGKTLATYWVHSGLLVFGKEKMSKSLGNIVTTDAFLKNYGGETLRLMTALQHYRSPVDFTEESILRAEGLLERLYHCKQHAQEAWSKLFDEDLDSLLRDEAPLGKTNLPEAPTDLRTLTQQMEEALFDDFNSAKAMGFLLKAARLCFRENKPEHWAAWGAALPLVSRAMGLLEANPTEILGIIRCRRLNRMGVSEEFCHQIDGMLAKREEARAAKNYAESDRLRAELEAKGIQVMDGPDGVTWTVLPKN